MQNLIYKKDNKSSQKYIPISKALKICSFKDNSGEHSKNKKNLHSSIKEESSNKLLKTINITF